MTSLKPFYAERSVVPASGLEPVSHPGLGEQVLRPGRFGLQLAAQLGHIHPQVVGLGLVRRPPHLAQQLALGDQPPVVAHQDLQQLPLGRGQPDVLAVAPDHLLRRQVDGEVGGGDDRLLRGRRGPGGRGPQPGPQLVHAERLRHVVIRPRVQRRHLLAFLAPRGQHDDRDRGPAAHAVDDLGAVHVGQPEVQDDHVGPVAGHRGQAGGAVDRGADVVLPGGQVDAQRAQDGRLVVDDQHAGHDPVSSALVVSALAAAGSVMATVSPPPGVSRASIRPPMASANPRATARPRPTPPGERSPMRVNGSKMRSFASTGTPAPWSTTSSTTRSAARCACSSGGRTDAGECRSALENRLASTRSSRPGSASTSGKPSGTAISTRSESSSPSSATPATSSIAVGRRNGCSDPVCSRLMSSRLPISASSRSAFCSMVASRSPWSASDHSTSVCRRLLTLALIDASGVRKSWLTAASSAVRIRLPSASASAWAAWVRSRSRSRAAAAWAAYPASRAGVAESVCPVTSRIRSARMSILDAAARLPSTPLEAARIHRPATRSCSSAWPPWVRVRCSSTAAGESAPPSTVCASSSSEAASSRARAAWTALRAARWTTPLAATATVTNSSRASSSRGCWMVKVWIGSVKYQLSSRLAATAASTAGQKPPSTVTATTTTR